MAPTALPHLVHSCFADNYTYRCVVWCCKTGKHIVTIARSCAGDEHVRAARDAHMLDVVKAVYAPLQPTEVVYRDSENIDVHFPAPSNPDDVMEKANKLFDLHHHHWRQYLWENHKPACQCLSRAL